MATRKKAAAPVKEDCPAVKSQGASISDRRKGSFFTRFTAEASRLAGRPEAFIAAALIVVVWAATGPIFGFSEIWQLVINTGTTIITFLMVFIIQASQNRDTVALHLKIDELIRATGPAHNALLDIDSLDESQLEKLRARYESLAETALEEADILEEVEDKAAVKSPRRKRAAA